MTDIAIFQTSPNAGFDIGISGNDLQGDEGLQTAVVISLFTDARADESVDQSTVGDDDPRGWWGDLGDPDGVNYGSLLWTLRREKITNRTLALAEEYCRDALQWMIDDEIAERIGIQVERAGIYQINIGIDIFKPGQRDPLRYNYLWDAQRVK